MTLFFVLIKYLLYRINIYILNETTHYNRRNENIKFKPTVQWMQENYDKANRELFGGQLGECIFRAEPIKSNTHWLGSFRMGSNNLYVKSSTRRLYIKDNWGEETFITHDNFF